MSKHGPTAMIAAYIDGQWQQGSTALPSLNPADLRDEVGVFADASKDQVRQAAYAAKAAYKSWAATPAPVRRFLPPPHRPDEFYSALPACCHSSGFS